MRALAVLIVLAGWSPAFAGTIPEDAAFQFCDGYMQPGRSDAYLSASALLGLASMHDDIRPKDEVLMGYPGADACDIALASTLLKPEFVARHSHMLLAKALHLVAAGRAEHALGVLDEEALFARKSPDPLRAMGLGIASTEVRALALIRLNRKADADAQLTAIELARPFALTNREFVRRARLAMNDTFEGYLAGVRDIAPVNPGIIPPAMVIALRLGRYDDVMALGRGITVALPRMSGSWQQPSWATTNYDLVELRTGLDGMLAYAEAARGDGKAASTRLAAMGAMIETYGLPPPSVAEERWSHSVSDDYNHRLESSGKARRVLDAWLAAIALRQQAPALTGADLQNAAKSIMEDVRGLVWSDLIGHIGKLQPGEDVTIRNIIHTRQAEAVTDMLRASGINLSEGLAVPIGTSRFDYAAVLHMMPRPEIYGNQPRLREVGDRSFLSNNGYSTKPMDLPDQYTVSFANQLGTTASIEEQAVFNIAALARSKGKDRFIIEARRELARTIKVIMYGREMRQENAGHETQFVVRLLNSGPLPSDLVGAEWRVMSVDSVLAKFPKQDSGTK